MYAVEIINKLPHTLILGGLGEERNYLPLTPTLVAPYALTLPSNPLFLVRLRKYCAELVPFKMWDVCVQDQRNHKGGNNSSHNVTLVYK